MAKADWFLLSQVAEAFTSFLQSASWPTVLHWKVLDAEFKKVTAG